MACTSLNIIITGAHRAAVTCLVAQSGSKPGLCEEFHHLDLWTMSLRQPPSCPKGFVTSL